MKLSHDGQENGAPFPISSEDCEFLLLFEKTGSPQELAHARGRDLSVISRQIKNIAERAPVIQKVQGRWKLTPLGKQVCDWSRKAILEQQNILRTQRSVTIGTTPEFASQVLAPGMKSLLKTLGAERITILTQSLGAHLSSEDLLLGGRVDFCIECERPDSPLVAYKQVQREPMSVVCHPDWLKKAEPLKREDPASFKNFQTQVPAVQFSRIALGQKLKASSSARLQIIAQFDTIAATRAACAAGMGWTILPDYSVREDLHAKKLVALPVSVDDGEHFGIWWSRENKAVHAMVKGAIQWLKDQKL